jgi:hypothetical protein
VSARTPPLRLATLVALLAACAREPATASVDQAPPAAPAADPHVDEVPPAVAEAPACPLPDEILTPWQFALIVMDPHHLTVEQRRQRAYARRKAVMLNPDSVSARVLEDLAKAAEAGEIDPNASQMVFTARGVEGDRKGPPPAGWRPPADADDSPAGASAPGAEGSADAPAPSADGSP